MKKVVIVLMVGLLTSISVYAKDFYMITQSVTSNHLKFKQTSDKTWLMYVPATYPCPNAGGNAYTGFQFIVGDDEGYLYTPQSKGQMVNGEDGSNSGTLTKSTSKRDTWWNWWSFSGNCLEVKKNVPQSEQKNPYNGMTSKDLVMDGCLELTIKQNDDGSLTYKAKLNDQKRVAYAACNCTEGSDNGSYYAAKYTTFLFADKQTDGTFSPYYKGKVVVEKIPSENYNQVQHNGFYFYTPIQEKYEASDAAGNKDDWWAQVKNELVTRGISPNGADLYQNSGNFESPIYGSFNVSTTFYYGGNNQGRMEKKLSDAYDQPLVGSIRTYCNKDHDMQNRYHVHSYIAVGYHQESQGGDDQDAFILKEIPFIPKGVGVLLYTNDATVDTLAPRKDMIYTGTESYDPNTANYLVPTFVETPVHTYEYVEGKKYINFFLGQLYHTKTWKKGTYHQDQKVEEGKPVDNYWGFFSAIDGEKSYPGRAYLHFPADDGDELVRWIDEDGQAGAKCAIGFDDNHTTGITQVTTHTKLQNDDAYYTVDGRRVAKPTHGIFIHNGKTYLYK